jgi:hypothetical protein
MALIKLPKDYSLNIQEKEFGIRQLPKWDLQDWLVVQL